MSLWTEEIPDVHVHTEKATWGWRKDSQPQAKERDLRKNQPCRCLDLGPPASRKLWENTFLLYIALSLWCLLWQPELMSTNSSPKCIINCGCCRSRSLSRTFRISMSLWKVSQMSGSSCKEQLSGQQWLSQQHIPYLWQQEHQEILW